MSYEQNVFINCPFDPDYRDMMYAIVFTVHDCGFVARSALELADSSEVRVTKILRIIEECRLGVHDISRTELDDQNGLPRFNMPLELGFFLGAKRFGKGNQTKKRCLVLDREPYRYQAFCSDIAGQEVSAHHGDPLAVIPIVRDWLRGAVLESGIIIPGGARMTERYQAFRADLPDICTELRLDCDDLIFNDFTTLAVQWLQVHEW